MTRNLDKRWELDEDEIIGATSLGYSQPSWDCWINHYDSYGWIDLVNNGYDLHYSALGWTEAAWERIDPPPPSEEKRWDQLNESEQLHAAELCFFAKNWNKVDMTPNNGVFPFPKPLIRFTPWENLSYDQQRIAINVLLYNETTWNVLGLANIEKRAWNDLSEWQKAYAIELELYERTWDCFQNHYRGKKWVELAADVQIASMMLGWNKVSWDKMLDEPPLYKKQWKQLSKQEQLAAYVVCYFEDNWDGNNLSNQFDPNYLSQQNAAAWTNSRPMWTCVLLVVVSAMVSVAYWN